ACGGLLTNGSGVYFQRQIYPNLFFLLLAPAASGKSSLTSAYDLLYPVHLEHLNKSLKAQEQYRRSLTERSGNNEPAVRPPFQSVLIPGNVTSSRLIQHLADNEPDVASICIESELDTISQANKSTFGSFSDILRKAFHNERVSLSRKGNDEFVEVKKPKLSLILSGTPKQLFRLVPSAEDGLYSRLMLYSFNPEVKWTDVSPDADYTDISQVMEKLSKEVYNFWRFFKGREVKFELSATQWKQLNEFFEEKLKDLASIGGEASVSVVKRAGVICFKLAMIITALRAFEFGVVEKVHECYDRDFRAALLLTELSLNCSLQVLEHLPDGEPLTSRRQKKENFKSKISQEPRVTESDAVHYHWIYIHLCQMIPSMKISKINIFLKKIYPNLFAFISLEKFIIKPYEFDHLSRYVFLFHMT
ncbi:MAG: DUF3987 domain-containing protein, partial [Sphingobacteriales bacterium]